MTGEISIVIIDDHPIFREGLKQALLLEKEFRVVAEGDCAADAVQLVQQTSADILLLDAWMADNGIDRLPEILALCPRLKVIVLSASSDDRDVTKAMEAGASGYVLKGTTAQKLHQVVRDVRGGDVVVDTALLGGLWRALGNNAQHHEQSAEQIGLSRQETKTLRLLADGMSNKEIARELQVSEKTVKYHVSNVFLKLGVRNRVQASIRARTLWAAVDEKPGRSPYTGSH
jgi:Response regulator containing a CheY-like receiver domain and an HTH DNA-binding domain